MWKRFAFVVILLIAGVSSAFAEDNFKVDISPELQARLDFISTRVEEPASNFGYRTIRMVIQPKQAGDRPVIWAKFYDAEGVLLQSSWDRVKVDEQQKCKFDYMDVQAKAVRVELTLGQAE